MKISFWWIGKTKEKYLQQGISIYKDRLKHYMKFEIVEVSEVKKIKSPSLQIEAESSSILSKIDTNDFLILCDENGQHLSSTELAASITKWTMNSYFKRIIIVIGGAFGVSEEVKKRANFKLSLSKMTFTGSEVKL